jgi:peptide/nickel transport system substrate-binding protein
MPKTRLKWPGSLILMVAFTLAACSSIDSGKPQPSANDNRPARAGGTLRIALDAEPDALDPTLARTLVGRTVFNAICEKLYDVDSQLAVIPQLAAALPEFATDGLSATIKLRSGVKFADGTSLDATAVKRSLDRHMTLEASARKSELLSVAAVETVDPSTVRIRLKQPFTPLTAVLADRAGMIMSPQALDAGDENQSRVCRTVQVRYPGGPGPHRGGQGSELLRRRPGVPRQGRLPDHLRRHHAVQQPALR